MESLLKIGVKYLGPTDFKGSRVKLTYDFRGRKVSRVFSRDYETRGALDQAERILTSAGIEALGVTDCDNGKGYSIVLAWSQLEKADQFFMGAGR